MEYNSLMESMARAVRARLGVAADLVRNRILHVDIAEDLKRDAITLLNEGRSIFDVHSYPGYMQWYVLDESGRVVLISGNYRSYLGIDFSSIFSKGFGEKAYHYLSLLTRRSVVGIAYPVANNFTLIIERDLVDIIPTIQYFTQNPIFSQEVIFLLSNTGRAIYHPDETVVRTRENLAFEMEGRTTPDDHGFFSYSYMGRKYLAMSRSFVVPEQWHIYYSLPLSVIRDSLRYPLLMHLLMMFVMFTFLFIILWNFLNRLFSRPVKNIVKVIRNSDAISGAEIDLEPAGGISELEGILQAIKTRDIAVTRAERDIFNEKERLAVTLSSIGDAVITTDTDSRIILMNPVAEKVTGWILKEARGRLFDEIVPLVNSETGEALKSPVKQAMASGNIVALGNNNLLIKKDDKKCNVADSAAPIFDREKNIIGAVVVLRDITRELQTQEELLKIKKLEGVAVLAGGIAHDFNNIIAAIMGNIELVQFRLKPSEKMYRQLDNAVKACDRAKDLALQLLTFSKGGHPVRKCASLQNLIRESVDFVLHGSNVVCNYDVPEDLWMAYIDQGQISQVMQNLVLNSMHAMSEGGEILIACSNCEDPVLIQAFDLPYGRYVKIVIKDTGMGMPEEIIGKIFDPYFSTKHTGSGLGLAIVHSIISKHEGGIRVKSPQGSGTTFTILIPASRNQDAQLDDIPSESLTAGEGTGLVLIMDDEAMVRELASDMLKLNGYETLEALDGKEALRIFNERKDTDKPVDLLIMDLTIPGGMGGLETMKELLKIDPDVNAVVASGYSNDPVISDYESHGFKGALVKPYTFKDLCDVVSQVRSR